MTDWYTLTEKEALAALNSGECGLDRNEVIRNSTKYGKNEIKQVHQISAFGIFLSQFKSLFILILIAAAIFSFIIGHYIDFVVIFVTVGLNSVIGFLQQYKAEKTIAALKNMLVPIAKVMRAGKLEEIPSINLVPGDVIILSEGDKVVADCRILYASQLQANEAILTGESFPQDKSTKKLSLDTELANRENMLYTGTTIVQGNAKALVVAIGMQTEFGKIAGLVQKVKPKKTELEEKLDVFSKKLAILTLIIAIVIIIAGVIGGESIATMLLTGIALAVSIIPEGMPAVIAITLAIAIQRMQKHHALIRKLPAAETLGRVTMICTDKTGTLTMEEMAVIDIYCDKKRYKVHGDTFLIDNRRIDPESAFSIKKLLKIGIMCNNARLEYGDKIKAFGDPTEKAIALSAHNAGVFKKDETEKEARVIEYSFSSKRKMMSIVRKSNGALISYAKGAPDVILEHCSKEFIEGRVIPLNDRRRKELILVYEQMASEALRVLGFAFKDLNEGYEQEKAEGDMVFAGFQGMIDPPRSEVKLAIRECRSAGIKIKMITGDSELTAKAVAKMIDLETNSVTEKELVRLSTEDFIKTVKEKVIFARITPEFKFKIIQVLKAQNEIVAVTGDGINDILALKEAHIGISMGIRGTDVTRDVSEIILLDDNFKSIVQAIKEGRKVYDNIKKAMKFNLAANFYGTLAVLFALTLALPLPLLPLSILWMNLITDSLPSMAFGFEKDDEHVMHKKPINPKEGILTGITKFIVLAGIILFIGAMIMFFAFYQTDLSKARTMVLTTAVFSELLLAFSCRSEKPIWKIGLLSNKFMFYSVMAAMILQLIAIYTPIAGILGLTVISLGELGLAFLVSLAAPIFFETMKFIESKKANGINNLHEYV